MKIYKIIVQNVTSSVASVLINQINALSVMVIDYLSLIADVPMEVLVD